MRIEFEGRIPTVYNGIPTEQESVTFTGNENGLQNQFASPDNGYIYDVQCDPFTREYVAKEIHRIPATVDVQTAEVIDTWSNDVLPESILDISNETVFTNGASFASARRLLEHLNQLEEQLEASRVASRKILQAAPDLTNVGMSSNELWDSSDPIESRGGQLGLCLGVGVGGSILTSAIPVLSNILSGASQVCTTVVQQQEIQEVNRDLKNFASIQYQFDSDVIGMGQTLNDTLWNVIVPMIDKTQQGFATQVELNAAALQEQNYTNQAIAALQAEMFNITNTTSVLLNAFEDEALSSIHNLSDAIGALRNVTSVIASKLRQVADLQTTQFNVYGQKLVDLTERDLDSFDLLWDDIRAMTRRLRLSVMHYVALARYEAAHPMLTPGGDATERVPFIDTYSMRRPSTEPRYTLGSQRVPYDTLIVNLLEHQTAPAHQKATQYQITFYTNRDLTINTAHHTFDIERLQHMFMQQTGNCSRPVHLQKGGDPDRAADYIDDDPDAFLNSTLGECLIWIEVLKISCEVSEDHESFIWSDRPKEASRPTLPDGTFPDVTNLETPFCEDAEDNSIDAISTPYVFKRFVDYQAFFTTNICQVDFETTNMPGNVAQFQLLSVNSGANMFITQQPTACGHAPYDSNYSDDIETKMYYILDQDSSQFEATMMFYRDVVYGVIGRGVTIDSTVFANMPLQPNSSDIYQRATEAYAKADQVTIATFAGIGPNNLLPVYTIEDTGRMHKRCTVRVYYNSSSFAIDEADATFEITGDDIVVTSNYVPPSQLTVVSALDDESITFDVPGNRMSRFYGANENKGTVSAIPFPPGVTTIVPGLAQFGVNNASINSTFCNDGNVYLCWMVINNFYPGFDPNNAGFYASMWEVELAYGPDGYPYCVALGGDPISRSNLTNDPTLDQRILTPFSSWCDLLRLYKVSVDPDAPPPGSLQPISYFVEPRTYSFSFSTTAITGESLGVDEISNCTDIRLVNAGPTAQTVTFSNSGFFTVEQQMSTFGVGVGCSTTNVIDVPRHGTLTVDLPENCVNLTVVVSRRAPNGTASAWVPCTVFSAADVSERTITTPTVPGDTQVYIELVQDQERFNFGSAMQAIMQSTILLAQANAAALQNGSDILDGFDQLIDQINAIQPQTFTQFYNFSVLNSIAQQYGDQVNQLLNQAAAEAVDEATANAQLTNITNDMTEILDRARADAATFSAQLADAQAALARFDAINESNSSNTLWKWISIGIVVVIFLWLLYLTCCRSAGISFVGGGGGYGSGPPVIVNNLPPPSKGYCSETESLVATERMNRQSGLQF
jgi:hypothetical protein